MITNMKKIIIVTLSILLICLCGCSKSEDEVEVVSSKSNIVENVDQVSEVSNVYYYNFLSDESKKYYDLLLEASKNNSNSISGSFSFNDKVFNSALYAFTYDYPLYYWWRVGVSTTYTDDEFTSSSKVKTSEIETNVNKIIEIKDSILAKCKDENNYQTIKNIHDYITNTFTYNLDNPNGHSIIGGIIDNSCVCDGYATTFKYLCNEAGFNCIIVEGHGLQNNQLEEHAWNKVELNNAWYNVDTTWDAPISDNKKEIIYDYFLLSDEMISADHFASEDHDYPEANNGDLLYFGSAGTYFKEYEKDAVNDFIRDYIRQGYSEFRIKFFDKNEGTNAYNDMLEAGSFTECFDAIQTSGSQDITYGGSYNPNSNVLYLYYSFE